MANMTFKASLLPNSDLGYSLGSSTQRWNIYGNLTGNASTADKWKAAITLTIGNTGKSVDGSANVSYSLAEIIGSAKGSQYLPIYWTGSAFSAITANSVLTNLGSTTAASTYTASPRPGVTGTLGIENGGTGKTTSIDAINNFLTNLPIWTAAPTDTTYFIRQDTSGANSFGRVLVTTMDNRWVKKTGDTMSGHLNLTVSTDADIRVKVKNSNGEISLWTSTNRGVYDHTTSKWLIAANAASTKVYSGFPIYGAVWNDYAEYRETKEEIEPGRCVRETGNGDLVLTDARMQEGCEIVSDTFGFAIGESEKCKTPTAATGRVLAYLYENRELAKPGRPVCSGPDGTVSLMTNEEAREYPWCIIGTVSEIPDYEIWYAGSDGDQEIKVNGRIWIRIR